MEEQELGGLEHIKKLLEEVVVPKLEGELAAAPIMRELQGEIEAIRETARAFSTGDIASPIRARGVIPGYLRTFQAHLRYLVRQMRMVEQGDFTQEARFMGEFAGAFNRLVRQMDSTIQELRKKEKNLTALMENLQNEVSLRDSSLEALQESESQLKYLADHDPLTGALNRRSFMEQSAAELKAASVRNIPCCLAMMDIDHFKHFNDTFGHQAGDAALCHSVRVISAMLRKNDRMGRYGGEEFVLFFYGADKKIGVRIAERVRASLESKPVVIEVREHIITASFGVTLVESPQSMDDPKRIQEFVSRADIALYHAKETGRNRVVCYSPELRIERS